ncbi:hypothetical protein JK635_16820 [Neobacillus sp. YIM B02564]|uniref:Uncharacterized protein n=1 Tax=Neobacillus paridis TaxID=2803862 RepID=A0ABS1TSZ7_9BACI|nr:hypothetical protein [Neobacillus paridis]MBL4953849.1 hypothetical protein [Neobacillus paridis]
MEKCIMNRAEFFKEMSNSLLQTVKSVYEPFISDDLEKVENAADRVLGITWYPLLEDRGQDPLLEMHYTAGKPIIVSRYGTNMQVFDGVCPVCSNIIMLSTLYSKGKCLNCQKEFNFNTGIGELKLYSLPVKYKQKMVYVGLQTSPKQGDKHA